MQDHLELIGFRFGVGILIRRKFVLGNGSVVSKPSPVWSDFGVGKLVGEFAAALVHRKTALFGGGASKIGFLLVYGDVRAGGSGFGHAEFWNLVCGRSTF
jgi:hypothetical protein